MLKKAEELKAQIDQLRPFEGNMLKQIKDYYKIGLTYTSNALEGNSLTETETKIKYINDRVIETQKDLLRLLK